jgi:hypothetical protein
MKPKSQTRIAKPPLNSPALDKNGNFSYVWQAWFDQLATDAASVAGVNSVVAGLNNSYAGVGVDGTNTVVPGSKTHSGYASIDPLVFPSTQGLTGIQGTPGLGITGVQGVTGIQNFLDETDYPYSGFTGVGPGYYGIYGANFTYGESLYKDDTVAYNLSTPEFLYNESDQALFVAIKGSEHWVQVSGGVSMPSITGTPNYLPKIDSSGVGTVDSRIWDDRTTISIYNGNPSGDVSIYSSNSVSVHSGNNGSIYSNNSDQIYWQGGSQVYFAPNGQFYVNAGGGVQVAAYTAATQVYGYPLWLQSGDYISISAPIIRFPAMATGSPVGLGIDATGQLIVGGGGGSLPAGEIGYGNGSAIVSSSAFTYDNNYGVVTVTRSMPEVDLIGTSSNGRSTLNLANELGSSQNFEIAKYGSGYNGTLFDGPIQTPTNNCNYIHSQTGNMAIQVESDDTLMMGAHNKVQLYMSDSTVGFECTTLIIASLPTSAVGLPSGALYRNGTDVKVVP